MFRATLTVLLASFAGFASPVLAQWYAGADFLIPTRHANTNTIFQRNQLTGPSRVGSDVLLSEDDLELDSTPAGRITVGNRSGEFGFEGSYLLTDKFTGRPRGFGFVEFTTSEAAQAATQKLDGYSLEGRNIRVNEATDRPAGGPGGAHGGRGFGGGAEVPGIHSICMHPTHAGELLVGISCGGVWVSDDDGVIEIQFEMER